MIYFLAFIIYVINMSAQISVNSVITSLNDVNVELNNFEVGSFPDFLLLEKTEKSSFKFDIDSPFSFNQAIISASVDIDDNDTICYFFYDKENVFHMGNFSPAKSCSFSKKFDYAEISVDILKFKDKIRRIGAGISIIPSSSKRIRRIKLINVVFTDTSKKNDFRKVVFSKSIKLNVPKISQMVQQVEYTQDICSPSSVAMVLGYYGVNIDTPTIASMVYDNSLSIFGNWIFNTSYVSTKGLYSFVARINSFKTLYKLLDAGVPVIASITFGSGELKGSPIKKTKGHIVVIKGLKTNGDVIVNDPAFCDSRKVEVTYNSYEFFRAWIGNKYGTSYIISDDKRISSVIKILKED